MTLALAHRGPDDTGFHARGWVRLGVRRLSLVDVAGGAQPLHNEVGDISVVVNGEIYNHAELRAKLQAMGHRFATRCDVEVIVHLYEEYKDRCVEHLRGMFAIAVADGDRLFLARDRLGIKPLYYSMIPGGVLFASEIKALLRCPELRPALDLQALADSSVIGFPVGDRTFIDGIRSVLPGHTMTVTRGPDGPVVRARQYYQLPAEHDESIAFDSAQDQLIDMLRETVRSHLVADVRVGLVLSGGLDSTVLAMLARDVGGPFPTFSLADHPDHPDQAQATRLAGSLGWPHHAAVMGFDDYISAIPGYTHAYEVPGSLGALPLYFLYKRVATQLKACLHGEGADELFGGYGHYTDRSILARSIHGRLRAGVGLSLSPLALEIVDIVGARQPLATYADRLLAENMRDQLVRNHLEALDKCAMAAGVEMRVPYMDHEIVAFVSGLPNRYKVNLALGIHKYVLRRAALSAWKGDDLVADSVLRRKLGAPDPGYRYRAELAGICERELSDDYLARHELGAYFTTKLDLVLHELFSEIFLVGRGADPASLSMRDFIAERTGRALPVSI
jgi:asparagine synthase (glutamine-hydrolysing)